MTLRFGFWKRLLNLWLLRSFLKGVHEPVRLLQFIPHIILFRYKFSQMLLRSVQRCHFPATMFFRLQWYVVSGGIALQSREVFSCKFCFLFLFLFFCSGYQYFLSVTVFPKNCSSPYLAGYPQCFSRDSKFLMFLSNRKWKELALRSLSASTW